MNCSNATVSVNEISATNPQLEVNGSPHDRPRTALAPPIASNALERLAQLMLANEHLMDELVTSRARILAARIYLDRPDCHRRFGSAHLERCRARHSGILAQLGANRIEALHLLG